MTLKKIGKGLLTTIKFTAKNFIRVLFLLIALSVFAALSVWFLMIHYINANNVGEQIAGQLEKTLGRTVLISRVKFILPTTFMLEDFKIVDSLAPDYKNMVSIKQVKLHFEIKPLLEHKIIVKEAVFEHPVINIVKTPKGLNIPEIHTKKHSKTKGTEFDFTTKEGTPWQVLIQDWVLQNGTFAFRNLVSNQSHSLNGLNLRFYNLEFNEDTLFDLNFILRNRVQKKIVEAETSATGKINFANFKPQEMFLKDTELSFYPFKKPIQAKLNINNFIEPKVDLTLAIPTITDSEFAFLFDTKNKYSIPDTEVSFSGEVKDNFSQINISSLSLKNKEIQLNANGNFNFSEDNIKGNFTVQNSKIDSSKIALYYKPLKPFELVGNVEAKGDFNFTKSSFKTKKLNLKSNSLSSKIFNFTVQKAKVNFDATENFNKMKAVFDDGIFLVGKTKITDIKGYTTLDYKKQDFYAIAQSAKLNGKPTRMSVGIQDVRQEDKRKIKMLAATSELNPLEIFDITQDFVNALSSPDGKDETQKDTSDLAWLRNFRTALPKFMINFSGSVYAEKFTSPVLSGQDFYASFDFTDLLPSMEKLGGNMDAKLSNGIIYKLQEAADNQKVLGIAYQPFVIMSKMERAGSFKMGEILKDTPFDIMSGSVTFKNGNMFVNNYYVDGSVISGAISGNVDWVKESFDLNIITMFKNTSKRGALSENLTDESGDPALAFVTYGKMSKPKLDMKSPKKVGKQIQAARNKDKEQFEEIKKFKE